MRQIEVKAGGLLYSIDYGHGSQGQKVKTTKVLEVTKATVTILSPSGMTRRLKKSYLSEDYCQYYDSEVKCLKAAFNDNLVSIKTWRNYTIEAEKNNISLRSKIYRLMKKVK